EEGACSWVLQIQGPPRLLISGCRAARNKDRSIGIISQPHVVGPVAQVAGRYQPVGTKLPLNGEVPLLYVGRPQVKREADIDSPFGEECAGAALGRKWLRERRHGQPLVRITQAAGRA